MLSALLADILVAIHAAYVAFVVFGQLLILIGIPRNWSWIRNPWFRWPHLAAIVIVAVEALLNIPCPLTVWENQLRELAGQQGNTGSFIGHWLHELIFFDFPPIVFTVVYVAFAALVAGTFWAAPPRRIARR